MDESSHLSNPILYICFFLGIGLQYLWFYGLPIIAPRTFQTQIQKSWILTTASSVVMTTASLPFLYTYFQYHSNLSLFPLLNSFASTLFCAYFCSYLVMDMFFGYYVYPDNIDIVTGWVHHCIYLVLIPMVIYVKVPGAFLVVSFMELPTIFLAIGFLNSQYKSELLFGASFFVTRLLFHVYFATHVMIVWPDRFVLILMSISTLPLHIFWFFKWVQRQIRLNGRAQEDDDNDPLLYHSWSVSSFTSSNFDREY